MAIAKDAKAHGEVHAEWECNPQLSVVQQVRIHCKETSNSRPAEQPSSDMPKECRRDAPSE